MKHKKRKREILRQIIAIFLCLGMLSGSFNTIPIVQNYIPQIENVQAAENWLWPVPGHIGLSQRYKSSHPAIDINDGNIAGANIVSTKSGTVKRVWNNCRHLHRGYGKDNCSYTGTVSNGFGNGIVIKHDDGTIASYAHMAYDSIPGQFRVIGARVKQGDVIGRVGSAGWSTGYHLHFSISSSGDYWMNQINNNRDAINYIYSIAPPPPNYVINTVGCSNITNTAATIHGSMSPGGTVSSWGFYIGTDPNRMQRCTVSAGAVNSGNMSANIASYYTLRHGTRYYYKVWGVVNGAEKIGAAGNFTTTSEKPAIPSLRMNEANADLGIGDAATVNWPAVANTSHYKLYLYNEKNELLETSSPVTGTKYAFAALKDAGKYSAYIEAYNEVGTKGRSSAVTFTVHPDVTVKFIDADTFVDVGEDFHPEVLSEQTVHYGKNALAPAAPSHTGYTFKKWSQSYEGVKEDLTIKAEYDINQYTVTYIDSTTSQTLGTEKVNYYSPANPVAYDTPTGYVKTGFDGWDRDYKCITEDITLNTCIGWYNENFPIYAQVTSAVREYDAAESDNEGYSVKVKLKNWDQSTTKGRIVVALKTKEGKLLTSTESSAFSMKKNTEKEQEIFVPYDKAATIAEAYVIGQYKDAVPITTTASNNASLAIDQTMTYTNWSTEQPPEGVADTQSKTEYRHSDKSTTTSYNTSLSGYTQNGSSWVHTGGGTVDYVQSFPAGFNTGNYFFGLYNRAPVTPFENATDKAVVSTSVAGYLYWHWCRGGSSGPNNRLVSDGWTPEFNTFHAHTSHALGYNGAAGAFQSNRGDVCRDTYWWLATGCWSGNQLPVYRCNYATYKKLFNYYKWSDFSEWGTTPYQETADRKVESRTVYRYQSNEMMQEDNSGEERTVSGSLGAAFAGKEAALFIYKVDEASDYTNEYVAQTVLDGEGNYNFHFKLREEPSAQTGDMTVVLGVEGASTAIYLDTIKAPRKEYTVNFYDYKGEVISTQTVLEGDTAELPDPAQLEREGYTFTKWSDTNTNIQEDKDIYAEYEVNKYHVVFVDWQANTVTAKEFDYGSQIVAPIAEEPEEGTLVEWDLIADGANTVTDHMVICTRYRKKNYDVKIQDMDGKVVDTQKVEHGKAVALPEIAEEDGRIFLGWKNIAGEEEETLGSTLITQNAILCPEYVFSETVGTPTADVESGEYKRAQKVTLSCETEGASIYYTLDGSDPTTFNGILYTGPITIDDAVELRFYAAAAGMNDSNVVSMYYAVNYKGARSAWLTYDELPEDVRENPSEYEIYTDIGYSYKDVKKTKFAAEAAALENAGWRCEEGEAYTEYTKWMDEPLVDDGSYIQMEGETRPSYTNATKYQYSHYVYTDGTATCYSPEEVNGYECKYETKEFDNPLRATFGKDGTLIYIYDGQTWFNQTKVTGKVQSGMQYRYRYREASYYKWSEYTTDLPDDAETREYKQENVYTYVRHGKYLVNIFSDTNLHETVIAEDGEKIDVSPYQEAEGYVYQGIYKDAEYREKWNPEQDTVSSSMDLYVKMAAKEYTVTFVYADGGKIESQKVAYTDAAQPPRVKEIKGYKFVGWDTDAYQMVTKDLTVTAKYIPESEYATVSLDNEAVTLYAGKSIGLSAQIQPASHAGDVLEWASSDETVAVVSDTGIVTAVKQGEADITVKVKETGETATCKVTVKINTDLTLCLVKNSTLSVDDHGFLRGIKAGSNTVDQICEEFENDSIVCKDREGKELKGTALFGTGNKVFLIRSNKVLDEIEAVMTAEVTGEGVINNRDTAFLSRTLLNKEVPEDSQILAGDANGDGEVNNRDIALISCYLVGKESL